VASSDFRGSQVALGGRRLPWRIMGSRGVLHVVSGGRGWPQGSGVGLGVTDGLVGSQMALWDHGWPCWVFVVVVCCWRDIQV
jgi:hypothetical protein